MSWCIAVLQELFYKHYIVCQAQRVLGSISDYAFLLSGRYVWERPHLTESWSFTPAATTTGDSIPAFEFGAYLIFSQTALQHSRYKYQLIPLFPTTVAGDFGHYIIKREMTSERTLQRFCYWFKTQAQLFSIIESPSWLDVVKDVLGCLSQGIRRDGCNGVWGAPPDSVSAHILSVSTEWLSWGLIPHLGSTGRGS